MSMKNPPTPAGIEPATFRFVAQHLNHCATAVPRVVKVAQQISYLGVTGISRNYLKKIKHKNFRHKFACGISLTLFHFSLLRG